MEVGIVARKGSERAASLAATLRDVVADAGEAVWLDEETAAALDAGDDARPVDAFGDCDLVVAVGGDGTFLFVARNAGDTPIVGVNLGEVGFLNAVPPGDAAAALRAEIRSFRDGGLDVREAPRLTASADDWTSTPAANEVVVQGDRRGPGGGIEYEVRVDGSRYAGGHADGVLVATPTGSTAYNLSERGPLVHPDVDGIVVNEMVAEEGMPPLVVDTDATVTVSISGEAGATVVSDGRDTASLDGPVEVTVERTAPPIRVAGPPSDFFEALGKLS
ncbi:MULTISPECIES: NAD(+)/NADH kinase [Halorubrum]|uniref:NAD kinase n=1 Tax=Halorubrum hochstenium ATCC 700873 TaxID=1227481 RepID=M0F2F8_9EURY|nr:MULTISPECIES: NAD(+)/NADH kinase [Halorubrum]ELZ54095.1 ATP-NAD/AcoX kinase [Halorubrum hochstenium ATCC 700873]